MAKAKTQTKPTKGDKAITAVKAGAVTKPAQAPKAKSKVVAKEVAKKASSKKSKKEESSDEDSEEDSDSNEDEDSSASDDDSEVEAKKSVPNGKAKTNGKAQADDSDDDSDDSDDSEESDEEPEQEAKPVVNGKAKANGTTKKAEADDESSEESDSSDDDDESDEDEEEKPKKAAAAPKKSEKTKTADSDDDEDDSEDDSDDDSEDSDDSDESDEEEAEKPVSNKRKAEDVATPQAKKQKSEAEEDGPETKNLFVGSLSWNVDDEMLGNEFSRFGEIVGARVVTDRESGRSKGFGYVEFSNIEDAINAHKEMTGAEIDGRTINIDFAKPRDNSTPSQRQQDRSRAFGDQPNEPSDTLFVGNLAFEADESVVSEAFSQYGSVMSIRLPTRPEDGSPKGFGYVTFASIEDATAAYDAMQGGSISGRPIRLDYSKPRDQNGGGDRGGRGRGGFGGGRGRGGDRGGFGGRGGGRGRGGDRGGRGRGGFASTNRGGFGLAAGKKVTF